MVINKHIREAMQSELLNIQLEWIRSTCETGINERKRWAEYPRNFMALIQKAISDPEFLHLISVTPLVRQSLGFKNNSGTKNKPIACLDISARTMAAIEDANIKTVGELYLMACKNQLRRIKGLGSMYCLMDIAQGLRDIGMPVVKITEGEVTHDS